MRSFKQFVAESINDKGILKAIFVVGVPGAGKSYTISQIKGSISPVIVNTDKAVEHLSRKWAKVVNSDSWPEFKDTAHRVTKAQLFNYLNSMLPLFVDGTSNDISNILHRMGVLESVGYDIGVVFIKADVDLAIKRAEERAIKIGRSVDTAFIRKVYAESETNVSFLRGKVSFFKEINNSGDDLVTAADLQAAFVKTQSFFSKLPTNPIGVRTIAQLKDEQEKYLVPSVVSEDMLRKKIEGWYK